MKPEENYKNDMDYLAQKGFEEVPIKNSDLNDLRKKIRKRTFSVHPFYWSLGSLVVGVSVGYILFFDLTKKNQQATNFNTPGTSQNTKNLKKLEPEKILLLDTVAVSRENFVNPSATKHKTLFSEKIQAPPFSDSVEIIVSKPFDLSMLNDGTIKEEKLKYMINAPVFYLHDMKITNYTTLYFKKNRFVKFTGLSAAYSNRDENTPAGTNLKQNAEYYLHEEIAEAMLQFKKEKYDEAISTLKKVADYNTSDLNCDFYMGTCYYHKKNFSMAIKFFDACITNSNTTFLQEATYYKALCLWESGDKAEAKTLFKTIAEADEFYAVKADGYLKQ